MNEIKNRFGFDPFQPSFFRMYHERVKKRVSCFHLFVPETCLPRIPDRYTIKDLINNILEERYEDGWRSDEL